MFMSMRGAEALFTDPHFRADPISYPVPTCSALMQILRAPYWKPEFEFEIKRFAVTSEIEFSTAKHKVLKSDGGDDRTLSTVTTLQRPSYVVEFEIVVNPLRTNAPVVRYYREYERKFYSYKWRSSPYFGRSEYPVILDLVDAFPEGIKDSRPLGRMLYNNVPNDEGHNRFDSVFWSPVMRDGVVEVPESLRRKHRDQTFRCRNLRHRPTTCDFTTEGSL